MLNTVRYNKLLLLHAAEVVLAVEASDSIDSIWQGDGCEGSARHVQAGYPLPHLGKGIVTFSCIETGVPFAAEAANSLYFIIGANRNSQLVASFEHRCYSNYALGSVVVHFDCFEDGAAIVATNNEDLI